MEWLRDPIWQFVGAIIGITAIIVSYFVFKRQQKVKSIVYEIVSNTSLVSVESEIKNKMKVFFAQKEIGNLNLLILRIQNLGSEPVLPIDYEKPITINFEETAEILEAESTDVFPKDLQPSIEKSTNKISLFPILLNEKDYITLKVLLSDFNGKVIVSGRIAGVKQILRVGIDRLSYRPKFLPDLIFSSFMAFCTPLGMFWAIFFLRNKEYFAGVLYVILSLYTLLVTIQTIRSTNEKINKLRK